MRAIAIEAFGTTDELRRRALPTPEIRPDELLIKVVNAGVSSADCRARKGELPALKPPCVPGFELAGVIERLGDESGGFRIGQSVYALARSGGGYGQWAAVRASDSAPLPPSTLFEEAAVLALDGVAAWRAVGECASAISEDRGVVVHGAANGAGHLALQLAAAQGTRVVATASDDRERQFLSTLGFESVPLEQAQNEAASAAWIDAEDGSHGHDLSGGAQSFQQSVLLEGWPRGATAELLRVIQQKRLRPRLFKILNIAQANDAQKMIEQGRPCGKLSLSF
jgi:NADPH:quinone reductase-like Zn-dependent oxidoreductase